MTALNFPDSPSNGDTYQGYTYNSTKGTWAKPEAAATAVYANIAALPTSGTAGDMAYVTATNRLYLWTGTGWYNIALINNNPTISGVNSSYALAIDGTATTVTITATDPEGLPITYSLVSDTSGNTATVSQGTGASTNVFTITPSTNTANAGTFSLTFRASDGVNIASSAASFTLQFSVENSNYTTALITSVGANNAVNNTFDDKSSNDYSMTVNGDAHQTTFSPYRHGGYSMKTVAGSSLGIPASTDNQFTGDFTIEGWVYSFDVGDKSLYVHGSYFAFNINFGTGFNIYLNSGGASFSPTDIVPASNQWNHVALVRSGSTVSVYLNGVASATTGTNSATLGYNSIAYIGGLGTQSGGSMNGYISDFRVVNGTAVYTSNFTPPTERLTAVTNTSVLACHLPYIADGSTNDKALAANGTITLEPFAPYDEQEYSAADHLGSAHFDGTGDSLNFTTTGDLQAMGRSGSACTVEAWVYLYSVSSNGTGILAQGTAGSASGSNIYEFGIKSDRRVRAVINGGYSNESGCPISAGTVPFKAWTHLAWVLHNQTWTIYINGKADGTATGSYPSGTTHNAAWIGRNHYDAARTGEANIADLRVNATEALYTSNFTPPTAPVSTTSNTVLHMPMTDAGIIDKSQSVKTINLSGDTKSSTTQSKYLTSSIKFDGNDYMTMPDIELGSSDYTVECWAWISAQGGTAGIFSKGSPGGLTAATWSLEFSSTNNYVALYIYAANSGAYIITGSTNIITSSWNHIAVTRSGNETKLFINGTQDGSTYTSNYTVGTGGDFYLGGGFYAPTSRTITGYMSDFRVTKGLARYTAAFTPPAAALQG